MYELKQLRPQSYYISTIRSYLSWFKDNEKIIFTIEEN